MTNCVILPGLHFKLADESSWLWCRRMCESVITATMKVNGRGGNLTPRHPKKPLPMVTKINVDDYVGNIYQTTTMQNFIQISSGVSVLRMRDFAPLGTKWFGYFLGSWERLQPRRANRFWRKNVKRRGSEQGSAFWGSRNQYLRFGPPFSSKTGIFGPHFDGT